MKRLFAVSILYLNIFILSSCNKDERVPPRIPSSLKPSFSLDFFTVLETAEYKYDNNSNTEIVFKDSLVKDSAFYLTRPNNRSAFDERISVKMQLNANNTFLKEVKWKIGTETTFREGKSISVDFDRPVGALAIKCYFSYDSSVSNTEVVRVYDTLTKDIMIGSIDNFNFTYLGYDLSSPADTFRVTLQYAPEPLIPATQNKPYYNLKGLPFKYSYAVAIVPKGNVFGSFESVDMYQLPRYGIADGYYFSSWYGNGFFKSNFDSLYIKYSFVKQKSTIKDTTVRTQNRTFVGKRIQ